MRQVTIDGTLVLRFKGEFSLHLEELQNMVDERGYCTASPGFIYGLIRSGELEAEADDVDVDSFEYDGYISQDDAESDWADTCWKDRHERD